MIDIVVHNTLYDRHCGPQNTVWRTLVSTKHCIMDTGVHKIPYDRHCGPQITEWLSLVSTKHCIMDTVCYQGNILMTHLPLVTWCIPEGEFPLSSPLQQFQHSELAWGKYNSNKVVCAFFLSRSWHLSGIKSRNCSNVYLASIKLHKIHSANIKFN